MTSSLVSKKLLVSKLTAKVQFPEVTARAISSGRPRCGCWSRSSDTALDEPSLGQHRCESVGKANSRFCDGAGQIGFRDCQPG